jgi:hypothetical protein
MTFACASAARFLCPFRIGSTINPRPFPTTDSFFFISILLSVKPSIKSYINYNKHITSRRLSEINGFLIGKKNQSNDLNLPRSTINKFKLRLQRCSFTFNVPVAPSMVSDCSRLKRKASRSDAPDAQALITHCAAS